MDALTNTPLKLSSEQMLLLAELIATERAKLLIEIRHTDKRTYREELTRRLGQLEDLATQLPKV